MTTYTLQALDADGNARDTLALPDGVGAHTIGKALVLRVPAHWPASEYEALRDLCRAADIPLAIVVPDYVTALRLVEPQPAPPAEWTGDPS